MQADTMTLGGFGGRGYSRGLGSLGAAGIVQSKPATAKIVPVGTRVSFRGSVYDPLGVPFAFHTQSELDAIQREVEKGEYQQVRVTSNYSYIIIEATVGHAKVSKEAMRDREFIPSIIKSINAVNYFSKAGSVKDVALDITEAVPEVIPPRIPPNGGTGGGSGGSSGGSSGGGTGGGGGFLPNLGLGIGVGTPLAIGGAVLGVVIAARLLGR